MITEQMQQHFDRLSAEGKTRQLIFVASAFRGNVVVNVSKACGYCHAIAAAGHVPFAPHLLYPRFLDDDVPEDRDAGIAAGLRIMEACDEVWFIGQMTEGMRHEARAAASMGKRTFFIGSGI